MDIREKLITELCDAAEPFTSGNIVDVTSGTGPLMENLEKQINRARKALNNNEFSKIQILDSIAVHTLHLLWLLDSEKWPELKTYFDSMPRGLYQHVSEIQQLCAEAGSRIAQTGKIE